MGKVLLIGEPLALLIAETAGPLKNVERFTRKLAGAEVNVSFGLKRLGHEVIFITRLGKDPFGDYTVDVLKQEGINTDFITYDNEYVTGSILKGKVEEGDPPIAFYCKGSATSRITEGIINGLTLEGLDFIHITGVFPAISESCFRATKQLMKRAKDLKIPMAFDPNLRPGLWGCEKKMVEKINELALLADFILPGLEEGKILTGQKTPAGIADFYQERGVGCIIVKLGSKGAYLREGKNSRNIPGFKVDTIVDTVGAGDGFAAGVVSALLEGLTLSDAVRRGNAIGSLQIQHISDNEALPTRVQLESYMKESLIQAI